MEHVYHLNGSLSELQEILQGQFDMGEDVAKLAVCLLVREQQQTVNGLNESETELWYFKKGERFTAPIFKTRYSVSLTDARKDLLEQLIVQFGGWLVDGDTLAFSTILSCLLAVYRAGTHIRKEECCVYYQALGWKATHASLEYFKIDDIMPHGDGGCSYLDKIQEEKWECNSCHGEECTARADSFRAILNGLCERKVFVEFNGMYRFTR
ncbi:hypothetical protein [uncultured Acetatifactor sp.]|jgi:hypothetical protein|uniref:hypothetical protein n=1 Tax=uncultured Acetatifactor sp. TaxID=1671927 RepID=UPI0026399A27|nr:hypothetical protein [uncultured Acetatifactor sp.]